jgi:putative mRNA 3-end processing factor
LKPEELWITHGNEEALLRWAALNNISATALEIAGYEEEEE